MAGLSVTVGAGQVAAAPTIHTIPVGHGPFGIATSGGHVYVAAFDDDTVSVIDQATNTVSNTIIVGDGPYAVATDDEHVYVSNGIAGTLSVIDQATNTVTATITVGYTSSGVTVGGGQVYVANDSSDTVVVIDQTSNTVSKTIPVGTTPTGAAAAGEYVYVTNYSDGTVSVIDQTSNVVVDTITVGGDPSGVAVDGGNVYVANTGDGTVSVINQATNTVSKTIPVDLDPSAVAAGGGYVYVAAYKYGTVSVIDQATNAVIDTFDVSSDPHGIAIGGDQVYVTDESANTVSVFDAVHLTQPTCHPFPDVYSSNPHCGNIEWLAGQGITKPVGGNYNPAGKVTRGSMAAFLFRLTNPGQTSPKCTSKPFPDVSTSNVFCGYIQWAKDNHIAFGHNDHTYRPSDGVTRGAMSAYLYRIANTGIPAPQCTKKAFDDVKTIETFCGTISWAKTNGITYGVGGGKNYGTNRTVNRQSVASFLHRIHDYMP